MRKNLTLTKRVEIYEFLKHNIKVVDAKERIVEYLNGMSDQSVCKMFSCSAHQIASIRDEMFGKIKAQSYNQIIKAELESRITAIEEYLTSKNPNWRAQ